MSKVLILADLHLDLWAVTTPRYEPAMLTAASQVLARLNASEDMSQFASKTNAAPPEVSFLTQRQSFLGAQESLLLASWNCFVSCSSSRPPGSEWVRGAARHKTGL